MGLVVLLQTLVLRYSKWFDLYIVQLNNIYWKKKTQTTEDITSCWIAWTSMLKSSLVILLTKKDPMTNQQKIILTIKSCKALIPLTWLGIDPLTASS